MISLPKPSPILPLTLLLLGASSDIARALAQHYAQAGARLQLAARNEAALAADQSDLQLRYGAEVGTYRFDALDLKGHADFVARLDPLPDLVICVFGYLGEAEKARLHGQEAQRILATNFNGAVSVLDRLAEAMAQRGTGTLVGISSVAGDRGRGSNYHYGSAKAGFTAYLSGLRNALFSHGLHVLTVKPGYVRTRMTAGMELPGPLTAEPATVATAIARAVKRRQNVLYTQGIWRPIMWIIRHLPEGIFKRLHL